MLWYMIWCNVIQHDVMIRYVTIHDLMLYDIICCDMICYYICYNIKSNVIWYVMRSYDTTYYEVWSDEMWYDMICYDMISYDIFCDDMKWYAIIGDDIWCAMIDMLWYILWCDMIWYVMIHICYLPAGRSVSWKTYMYHNVSYHITSQNIS